MSERPDPYYRENPAGRSSEPVRTSPGLLAAAERSLALAASLFMVGGWSTAAIGCLLPALAYLFPVVVPRVKRAVWTVRQGRHGR